MNYRGDLKFDDSNWASDLYIPPDLSLLPAWSDTGISYYEADTVAHSVPAGEVWVCIQDNVSSSANEPGTPGGAAYWVKAIGSGWDGGADTETTCFVWTHTQPTTILVKPDYVSY